LFTNFIFYLYQGARNGFKSSFFKIKVEKVEEK